FQEILRLNAQAAATTSASVRRSMSCIQEQLTEGSATRPPFGLPEVLVAVSTSRLSCKRAGKTRTLMPIWDSSGESRLSTPPGGPFHSEHRHVMILAAERLQATFLGRHMATALTLLLLSGLAANGTSQSLSPGGRVNLAQ